MGGTTAKASLIAGGEVAVTAEYEVGGAGHSKRWLHGTGHPIRVPVIDLAEVSAGGGSVAWVDDQCKRGCDQPDQLADRKTLLAATVLESTVRSGVWRSKIL